MDVVLPLHPKLVHLPIALALLMPLISAGVLVAWLKGVFPKLTWVVVIALQAVLLGSGIAALRTGEADEKRAETVISDKLIEAHEEAAQVFVWAGGVVLLLTVAGGVLRQERLAKAIAATAVAGTLVVLGLGYRTGQAGGELVYKHGAASAFSGPAAGGGEAPAGEAERHDKDKDDDD